MTCKNCNHFYFVQEQGKDVVCCWYCDADTNGTPNRVREITLQTLTKWRPGYELFTIAQMDELVALGALK